MTNLTEQWKKGKLPEGDYYIKRRNGYLPYDNIDSHGIWRNTIDEDIIEVLAPVPSYEEWKAKLNENAQLKTEYEKECHRADELEDSYWKEVEKNKKLKELLGECLAHLSNGELGTSVTPLNFVIEKIDEVLK